MTDVKQEIEKGVELLWLCQQLQSEKDGIDRPAHFQIDKSKTLDQFAQGVSRSVTNMTALYKLFPIEGRLSNLGRKLEKQGLIEVNYGDSYAESALAYFESKL
ncbi:conserved hypothetical protein [Vibrio crassostreae]|nr:conserved hypothetical protein [Vibrio crassostreae]